MSNTDVQVFKRGHSLRSIQRGATHIRVIYESDPIEVILIEIGPKSSVDESYLWNNPSLYLIVEGNLAFEVGDKSYELLRGEGIALGEKDRYKIHNLLDTKGIAFGFLFKCVQSTPNPDSIERDVL